MNKQCKIAAALALIAVAGGAMAVMAASETTAAQGGETFAVIDKDGKRLPDYTVPADMLIAKEPNADQIRYGNRLLTETYRLLPHNTGDKVNCNSCHVQGGKKPMAAPYINSFSTYPQYNARSNRVLTLEDRINGCFTRSMNGKVLELSSPEMQAMVAYMKWLAQDVPHGAKVQVKNGWPIDRKLIPDPKRGKALYAVNCAACHGVNGEGKRDHSGEMAFPPLWGDESFNIGAGMARTYTAAAFIRGSMPMGVNTHGAWGEGGVLSDQDAVDVAEYFTHMPRPDFPGKENDWPAGKKPKDARY